MFCEEECDAGKDDVNFTLFFEKKILFFIKLLVCCDRNMKYYETLVFTTVVKHPT